jgi:N-acetylmuramic acid 6-phosphate etherase
MPKDKRSSFAVTSLQTSPTERRNPRSMNLDRMGISEAVKLMLAEEASVPQKLFKERARITQAVRAVIRAFRRKGRLFYVGAGTSGRLGVLDASECPATFRSSPELVQGIIAGGKPALCKAIEGAEDDVNAGCQSIRTHRITPHDVVVGIAASGTTPFVWGALLETKRRRGTTILICFNPFLKIPPKWRPKIIIAPNLGPEVLTGSTRLKAGTATKILLNTFTTLAMVGIGKVQSNLMIDLTPANTKLRDRASRIVQEITRTDYQSAQSALEQNQWVIKKAAADLNRKRKIRAP